jgi:electron transport complex protein RnfB
MPVSIHKIFSQLESSLSEKNSPQQAVIREADCIGCTKCISACPVDAIVGAAKQMHTVMVSECIGCQLCVAPCPVDCIDMIAVEKSAYEPAKTYQRYQSQQRRLLAQKKDAKHAILNESIDMKKNYIQAAIARGNKKRQQSSA